MPTMRYVNSVFLDTIRPVELDIFLNDHYSSWCPCRFPLTIVRGVRMVRMESGPILFFEWVYIKLYVLTLMRNKWHLWHITSCTLTHTDTFTHVRSYTNNFRVTSFSPLPEQGLGNESEHNTIEYRMTKGANLFDHSVTHKWNFYSLIMWTYTYTQSQLQVVPPHTHTYIRMSVFLFP